MTTRPATRARSAASGFTLVEMLVATVLASIVLLGTFNFVTTMVSSQVNAERSSTVTAFSIAGISVMNNDIAAAGAVGYPALGVSADSLIVCTNWSNRTAPPAQVSASFTVDVYYYCYDTSDAPPYGNAILRKVVKNAGSCPTAPPACTNGSYGGGAYGADTVVATGVYRDASADPVFFTDNKTLNAVRLRYQVGDPNANATSAGGNGGTITANPVTIPFNTEIILED